MAPDGSNGGLPAPQRPARSTFAGVLLALAFVVYAAAFYLGWPLGGAAAGIAIIAGTIVYLIVSGRRIRQAQTGNKQAQRSMAIAWALVALVVMFYIATFVQFGGR